MTTQSYDTFHLMLGDKIVRTSLVLTTNSKTILKTYWYLACIIPTVEYGVRNKMTTSSLNVF